MIIFRCSATLWFALLLVACSNDRAAEDRARIEELEAQVSALEDGDEYSDDGVEAVAEEIQGVEPVVDPSVERQTKLEEMIADGDRRELQQRVDRLEQENLNRQFNEAFNR